MKILQGLYKWWATLLFVAVIVQIGAAGYGAFYVAKRLDDKGEVLTHKGFESGWDFHASFGYIVFLATIVLFVLALLARVGRPRIWWALAVPLLAVVQVLLAWIGSTTPAVGVFHPINAFVIATVVGLIAHRAWRGSAAT